MATAAIVIRHHFVPVLALVSSPNAGKFGITLGDSYLEVGTEVVIVTDGILTSELFSNPDAFIDGLVGADVLLDQSSLDGSAEA